MAEEVDMSEDEVIAELKLKLYKQWRRLAKLRKEVHANQLVPYSDVLELTTRQESPAQLPQLDNVALKTRLRFHQFRGAYVQHVTHLNMLLQFNTSHNGCYFEPFMLQLKAENGKYTVVKASLPVSVRLSSIEKRFLSEEGNLTEFIEFIQSCIDGFTFRKFDFDEFKVHAGKKFVANLRRTLNLHYVYMTMWLKNSRLNKRVPLNVMLKYDPDSCIPTDMKVRAVSEDDEEFASQSEESLSYFLKVSLREAFAIGVKDEASELLLEMSRSTEARSSTEVDSSRARSARRVLEFPSPASSGAEMGGKGSSSGGETSPRAQRSFVKKVSRVSSKAASWTHDDRPSSRLTRARGRGKRQ